MQNLFCLVIELSTTAQGGMIKAISIFQSFLEMNGMETTEHRDDRDEDDGACRWHGEKMTAQGDDGRV